MTWFSILFKFLTDFYLSRVRATQERRIKIKITEMYLKALVVARRSAIGVVTLYFILNCALMGFAILFGVALYFLPWTVEQKLHGLVGFGILLVVLPLGFLYLLLSERTWFRAAGADKMVRDLFPSDSEHATEESAATSIL